MSAQGTRITFSVKVNGVIKFAAIFFIAFLLFLLNFCFGMVWYGVADLPSQYKSKTKKLSKQHREHEINHYVAEKMDETLRAKMDL